MSEIKTQKDRIEHLMTKAGIKSQVSLLQQILKINGERDYYNKAQEKRGNFNKMIIGERKFLEEYIAPMEYLLKTTYNYIKNGGDECTNFQPDGIRYAAFIDDLSYYKQLDSKSDKRSTNVFKNSDEFSCSILDYILRYNSKNGIRYLIEQGYIKFEYYGKMLLGNIYVCNTEKPLEKVIDLLCEMDDYDLFDKFINVWNYCNESNHFGNYFQEILSNDLLIKLGNTKNILKNILKSKTLFLNKVNRNFENTQKQGLFCNPLVEPLLNYAIKVSENSLAKKILNVGILHNKEAIKCFENNYPDKTYYNIGNDGLITCGASAYGSLVIYEIKEQPNVNVDVYNLMQQLNADINSFGAKSKPLLGGFSNNSLRVIDGKIAKKSTNNEIEYQALTLFKNNNIEFVPVLEKQENGFDYFTYFPGETSTYVTYMDIDVTKELLLLLKKLNQISKKELNGKVYVHGDLWSANVVINNNKITGIIDWDSCHIGEEYEDIIYVLWTWLNIGDPLKDDEKTFIAVKKCLQAYSLDENLRKNWADKMIEVMENRLKSAPKESDNYKKIYKWVKESEIWVDLYRDRIKEEIG